MRVNTEGYPVNVTKRFANILEESINGTDISIGEGVIVVFHDPSYSAETGGYHPVEVMINGKGQIQYVTDLAYVGPPPYAELEKELDFDFSLGLFQQMGLEYPIQAGKPMFRIWQANFCEYHRSGVYEVSVTPC
ncbi:MAG: DUF2787 family protein [Magnetococcales bacterium]|nr:DUF2787 family protein [Magnetococcales bacterium]